MKYTLWSIVICLTFTLAWSLNRQNFLRQKANEPKIQLDSIFLQIDTSNCYLLSEFETYHRNLLNLDEINHLEYVHPIHIKYKQPINGYKVYVTWWMSYNYSGFALLKFIDDSGMEYFLTNEAFHIEDFDRIWEEASNRSIHSASKPVYILNYRKNNNPKDSLDYDAPFFFSDIDFDGQQELIMTLYKTGQRFCNEYKVYKSNFKYGSMGEVKVEPYIYLDGFTRFDYKEKKVILESHSGAAYYSEKIYKYDDTPYISLPLVFEKEVHY